MPSHNHLLSRLAALATVAVAFVAVHASYRAIKEFTVIGRLESSVGTNFTTGAVMCAFTVGAIWWRGKSWADYGFNFRRWPNDVKIGVVCGGAIASMVGMIIWATGLPFNPLQPPNAAKMLLSCCGELAFTFLLLGFLRRGSKAVRRIPMLLCLLGLLAIISVPAGLAIYRGHQLGPAVLSVGWLFFGAGFGEEIFFRGFIQSRLNEAFGRRWRILGMRFGLGLIISSVFFGLIHALNTVNYFHGQFNFAWNWAAANFCSGLFFGSLRERRRSILPGAIVHGIEDVLSIVPGLLP